MRTEHCQEERVNLEAKTQVFQNMFHFKAQTEENAILLVWIKNSYLTVLILCVFYVPSNEMTCLWQQKKKKEQTQSKLSKEWKEC